MSIWSEILVWPVKLIDAWVAVLAAGRIVDAVILAFVTVGVQLLSFVIDDEVGARLIGGRPFEKTGVKSLFLGLGPLMLFAAALTAYLIPGVAPAVRQVALLAWPAGIVWSVLVLPLYIAAGEMKERIDEALTPYSLEEADYIDFAIVSVFLALVAYSLYKSPLLSGLWNTLLVGYVLLSAAALLPFAKILEEESNDTIVIVEEREVEEEIPLGLLPKDDN